MIPGVCRDQGQELWKAVLHLGFVFFISEFVIGKTEENAGSNLFHVSFIIT